jgi:hypothetical protein
LVATFFTTRFAAPLVALVTGFFVTGFFVTGFFATTFFGVTFFFTADFFAVLFFVIAIANLHNFAGNPRLT